jgi:hypothetical protein
MACSRISFANNASLSSKTSPPVSISWKFSPRNSALRYVLSRVIPDSSATIAPPLCVPAIRFTSALLPVDCEIGMSVYHDLLQFFKKERNVGFNDSFSIFKKNRLYMYKQTHMNIQHKNILYDLYLTNIWSTNNSNQWNFLTPTLSTNWFLLR